MSASFVPAAPPAEFGFGAADGLLFRSFWMGGYEGADHSNSHGTPVQIQHRNGHDSFYEHDYAAAAHLGLRTVRESIGWRAGTLADGTLDVARLQRMADAAERQGVQVIWTLLHYGLPSGVDFFAPDFTPRFADFCGQVARALHGRSSQTPLFQPINEISFLSWAVGHTNLMHPYLGESAQRGYELKCRLVQAALQGCDALWAITPSARIVHADPLIHIAADHTSGLSEGADGDDVAQGHAAQAQALTQCQFEAWDMLCGRREPALGGAPRYLDVLGANYYHDNQWLHPSGQRLHWHLADPRRRALDDLLQDVWQRYRRPLLIAETGHVGAGRALWLDDVARSAQRALVQGVPLQGICLYPLLDRPDWEDPTRWHHSGLWDVRWHGGAAGEAAAGRACMLAPGVPSADLSRMLHLPLAQQLERWQRVLPGATGCAEALGTVQGSCVFPAPDMQRLLFSTALITKEFSMHVTTLIVFSHLRWDFVYQRPQQLLSRLAKRLPVLFVEEPVPGAANAHLEVMAPEPGVRVLRPHVPSHGAGFHDAHTPAVQALLVSYLQDHAIERYWLWFYTPMALPLAAPLAPQGVVYDCMDELSAFRFAPPELLQRENQLFSQADLVFTGGHSLYEAKRTRHPHVHCFPSSVDAAHFGRAANAEAPEHAAQAGLGRPRLGYFGVIDERIDLELVAALADAHADWQVIMVGPVVKIDAATLPQRANIHWLGQRDYAELPDLVAGWDVCLMPFALNESTRFISPTKTLEYLAAGRPVVSTPIRDVVTPYAGIVAIAATAQAFVAACEAALGRTEPTKERDDVAVQRLLARTSWDGTATAMAELIAERQLAKLSTGLAAPAARPDSSTGATPAADVDAAHC